MRKKIGSIALGGFLLLLAGCSSDSEILTTETEIIPEPVVTIETLVPEAEAPAQSDAEVQTAEVAVENSVEAVDRTTAPAVTAPEANIENRVISQETPVGDNPVMNPAGETLIRTAQVTFPDGGERIEVGKSYEIRWESEGIKALNLEVHQFGRPVATLAERVLAVEGRYAWTPDSSLLRGNEFAQITIELVDADTGVAHGGSPEPFMLLPAQ